MAYTALSDSSLDPDAPIKSEQGYAFRDNPIAIAQGDTSGDTPPEILWKALQQRYVLLQGNDTGNIGDGPIILPTELIDSQNDFDQPTGEYTAPYTAIVRITIWGAFTASSGGADDLYIQRDTGGGFSDVARVVDTSIASSTTYIPGYFYAIAVNAGDKLRLYRKNGAGTAWAFSGLPGGDYITGSSSTSNLGEALAMIEYKLV